MPLRSLGVAFLLLGLFGCDEAGEEEERTASWQEGIELPFTGAGGDTPVPLYHEPSVPPVTPDNSADPQPPTEPSDDETAPTTVDILGSVKGTKTAFGPEVPLEGVQVCVHGHSELPCAESDASGDYAVTDLPQNLEVTLTFNLAAYRPLSITVALGKHDLSLDPSHLVSLAEMGHEELLSTLPFTLDPAKPILSVSFRTNDDDLSLEGANLTLAPASGEGPMILRSAEDGIVLVEGGLGPEDNDILWFNLEPGEVELTVTHPTLLCRPEPTWPGEGGLTTGRILLLDGYFESVRVYCYE
ncbi:MAG: hypothetical protein A2284_19285 [Deltaproteobacteria bacterium RIFOXYA12_FULL_61_11]|nr:MAG: hypothetical protein A2284_19285 [Deltaproteobacteria bacterium RIFOXYA12_FULL_61_11]